jgi:hypothetical protein
MVIMDFTVKRVPLGKNWNGGWSRFLPEKGENRCGRFRMKKPEVYSADLDGGKWLETGWAGKGD